MNSVERTVIAATRAYGDIVREIRPLELRPEPSGQRPGARAPRVRRLRTWMTPLTAAAAVVALAISLVIVRDIPNGRVVPPAHNGPAATIPEYYVALKPPANGSTPDPVVIGDTRTGARLATVNPPAHHTFAGVTAAADDRTFVLDVRQFPGSGTAGMTPRSWYLLRIAPGTAHPGQLTSLPIPPTPKGAEVYGIALSPDGTRLAVMFQPGTTALSPGAVTLRIYSVATGKALRTWTGPTPTRNSLPLTNFDMNIFVDSNTTLSWTADGRHLTFVYATAQETTVRILDPAGPGHALLADSRLLLDLKSDSSPYCASLLLTADGRTIACGAVSSPQGGKTGCTDATGPQRPGFYEYSAVTGKLTRVSYQYQGACRSAIAQVLWASPSGGTLIGSLWILRSPTEAIFESGVISHGQFRPQSFPLPTDGVPGTIAW